MEVVDIELHPQEPPIHSRETIRTHGCVVLHYMPKCIYVRVRSSQDTFLVPSASAVPSASSGSSTDAIQLGATDMRGFLAVQPTPRQWHYKG